MSKNSWADSTPADISGSVSEEAYQDFIRQAKELTDKRHAWNDGSHFVIHTDLDEKNEGNS